MTDYDILANRLVLVGCLAKRKACDQSKKATVGRICNSVPCDRLGDLCQLSSARYTSLSHRISYRDIGIEQNT